MPDFHDDDLINKADQDFKAKLRLHEEYDPEPEPARPEPREVRQEEDPVRKLLAVYPGESVHLVGADGSVYALWNEGGRGRGNKRGHIFVPKLTKEQRRTIDIFEVRVPFKVRYVL